LLAQAWKGRGFEGCNMGNTSGCEGQVVPRAAGGAAVVVVGGGGHFRVF